jgi:hypothetical protein
MRGGRFIGAVAAVAAAVAVGAPAGFAATPQQIYKDYADNGRLDHQYSKGDLRRALRDAVMQGYKPASSPAPAIKKQLTGGVAGASLPKPKSSGSLPFTGFDLALMVVGGLTLLLFGAAMRRVGRSKA